MSKTGQEKGLFGSLDEGVRPSKRRPGGKSPAGSLVLARSAKLARIAFEAGGDNLYDYAVPEELAGKLSLGQRVSAPFGKGNRLQVGFCIEFPKATSVEKVKAITEMVDSQPLLNPEMLELAQWIAQYYCSSLGAALSAMVPAAVKRQIGMVRRIYVRLTEAGYNRISEKSIGKISSKGQAILNLLACGQAGQDVKEPISLDKITEEVKCGSVPFQTLSRQGLIELIQKREMPSPSTNKPAEMIQSKTINLNEEQQNVLADIERLIDQDTFNAVVLHGVTGSGKSEIYIRCIEKVLQQGKSALVLVPEISLTPQTVDRFQSHFSRVAVMHCGLTNYQRHQHWRWIAQGGAQVVVGARSAIFAPLNRLGLIVVDEEHEPSYKQDNTPRYHGRDVAIKRAQMNGITIILGSATPSLESLCNCRLKKHYHLLRLERRVMNLPMPRVVQVNMREELLERKGNHLLSRMLEEQMQKCLAERRQAILFLNRRGYSNYLYCPACQYIVTCPNCDVSLTYHRPKRQFESAQRSWVMCHYCLHSSQVPRLCPVCGKKLILIGPGTQQAQEEIARKFPQARLERVDSDSMKPGDYDRVMRQFAAGEIDILLGTQIIGKGLDFPRVSLVGVLNADTALSLPDFRSSERTFQLITQVAGRCGRASSDGMVVVQSFMPDEPAIKLACQYEYEQFAEIELRRREHCQMPPYQRMARLVMRDKKLDKVEQTAKELRENIDKLKTQLNSAVQVRGPVPANIALIDKYHRQEIIFTGRTAPEIQKLIAAMRKDYLCGISVQTIVDVDPINLM